MRLILLLILTFFAANSVKAFDDDIFLSIIVQRETGGDNRAIGRAGERSKYQFMRKTWYQHTRKPFSYASTDENLAEIIAKKHLEWIKVSLIAQNIEVNIQNCAWAWNAGVSSVVRGHKNRRVKNYIAYVVRYYPFITREKLTIKLDLAAG